MHILTPADPGYPKRLCDLHDPPGLLYIDGNVELLQRPMVAIVGARMASQQGIHHAKRFAQALSHAGLLVISGLARGIDGAAHRGCLELGPGFSTLAVCGTGLDRVYPPEHLGMARLIQKNGLLVSEHPPGVGAKAFHFPRRNRLIAALALGVVVIEGAERSGSLITARLASELGREVFALPGGIDQALSAGCNRLIQEGAKLARFPKDVLEELLI
jgi:DNA processing protein